MQTLIYLQVRLPRRQMGLAPHVGGELLEWAVVLCGYFPIQKVILIVNQVVIHYKVQMRYKSESISGYLRFRTRHRNIKCVIFAK